MPKDTTIVPDDAEAAYLAEIVAPRVRDGAAIGAAANLFATLGGAPCGFEIWSRGHERRFLLRAPDDDARRVLLAQVGAVYSQATIRRWDATAPPPPGGVLTDGDPAALAPGEVVAGTILGLSAAHYLPLRLLADRDIDGEAPLGPADPLLGVVGALGAIPDGWRAVAQLVARAEDPRWAAGQRRRALERPQPQVDQQRAASDRPAAGGSRPFAPLIPLGLGAAAWQAYAWYDAGQFGHLALGGLGLGAAGALAFTIARLIRRDDPYDPLLVREKLGGPIAAAELRLGVVAPPGTEPGALVAALDRLVAAYAPYGRPDGNRLIALAARDEWPLRSLGPAARGGVAARLNPTELAGLWHPLQGDRQVPGLERTAARRRLPSPAVAAGGPGAYPLGEARQGALAVPVALAPATLRLNWLLVGKPGKGKSVGLAHLGLAALLGGDGLLAIDPHGGLAEELLARVPAARAADVVWIDLADPDRRIALNLLDVGLGLGRDGAIELVLFVFARQFRGFWGPRMENMFRFGLHALYALNLALVAAAPDPAAREAARGRQFTLFDLPHFFGDPDYQRAICDLLVDDAIFAYWHAAYLGALAQREVLEFSDPVLTKIMRFWGSDAARALCGVPRSTIDPAAWVRDGRAVLVRGAAGEIGEDTAGLLLAALVNLVDRAVASQNALPEGARRRVLLLFDEIHAAPGANLAHWLTETRKWGGYAALATQHLGRLEAIEPGLRGLVLAASETFMAFNCGAEDAELLERELDDAGEAIARADLIALEWRAAYLRPTIAGQREPAFLLHVAPLPPGDAARAARLRAGTVGHCAAPGELDAALDFAKTRRDHLRTLGRAARAAEEAERAAREEAKRAKKRTERDARTRPLAAPVGVASPGGRATGGGTAHADGAGTVATGSVSGSRDTSPDGHAAGRAEPPGSPARPHDPKGGQRQAGRHPRPRQRPGD